MFRHLAVVAFVAALASSAFARDLTTSEKAALEARVASFVAIMDANDLENAVSVTPPRIHKFVADQTGVQVEDLLAQIRATMREAADAVTIENFGVDLESAAYLETEDGTPYVLIPTDMTMSLTDGGRFRSTSQTLGLLDEGEWFLLRVDELQQVHILREVYPEFVGVEFPSGSTQALE